MVDLMRVDWILPQKHKSGREALAFWYATNIVDRVTFAATWMESPREHFQKFSWGTTEAVLELLNQIAEHRTLYADSPNPSEWDRSLPIDIGLWNDTLDVVKYSPSHCGGWMGLLRVRLIHSQSAAVVDRPDPTGPKYYITWPPSTDRSLLGILGWFLQRFPPRPENYDGGDQWAANPDMLAFIRAQKATGRYEQLAKTVAGLAYENADRRLLHYYLSHLRGHGPVEPGRGEHHLFQMVDSHDADAVTIASDLDTVALDFVLKAFPGAWGQTNVGHWSAVVGEHIGVWRTGMGNHPAGLTWLSKTLQDHLVRWSDMTRIRTLLGGTREAQVTLGRTLSQSVTEAVTYMETINTQIQVAESTGTTTAWSQALTTSLTQLDTWSKSTKGGVSGTVGGSFGNTTAVKVGGETGAFEEFLIGKLTGEATTTIQAQLQSQFTTHLNFENNLGGSTTNASTRADTSSLQEMRTRSASMTRSGTTSLTQMVQRGQSITQNMQTVQSIAGSLDRQIENVRQGLEDGKKYVDRARTP